MREEKENIIVGEGVERDKDQEFEKVEDDE